MNDLFKSQVVLELEKDNSFYNSKQFEHYVEENYGFTPEPILYREIVNYQVKNYGEQLYAKNPNSGRFKSRKKRIYERSKNFLKYQEKSVIERAEKNEKNRI